MYDAEPYVMTDAIKANVTSVYFGDSADWLEEANTIQQIYSDCDRLKERIASLEDDVNHWRRSYMKLKIELNKVSNKEES